MNYVELDYKFLNKKSYMYIDTGCYFADSFFLKKDLHMKFFGHEINLMKYDQLYKLLFVKIPKEQESIFIECMNELNNKMLSANLSGYNELCDDLVSHIENKKVKKKVKVI